MVAPVCCMYVATRLCSSGILVFPNAPLLPLLEGKRIGGGAGGCFGLSQVGLTYRTEGVLSPRTHVSWRRIECLTSFPRSKICQVPIERPSVGSSVISSFRFTIHVRMTVGIEVAAGDKLKDKLWRLPDHRSHGSFLMCNAGISAAPIHSLPRIKPELGQMIDLLLAPLSYASAYGRVAIEKLHVRRPNIPTHPSNFLMLGRE